MVPYKTFLIAGPTASGKSGLALKLAQKHNGVIVNTDSMQVYRDLRIVTARPTINDELAAPHRLYGTIDAAKPFSTGSWLRAIDGLLPQLRREFSTVIFVGGTGLYFNALTLGLSEIPETPLELRHDLRRELAELGPQELHRQLDRKDPEMAVLLEPADGQRILRALEVLLHTGHSLRHWQNIKTTPLVDLASLETKAIVLDPNRDGLATKIEQRFNQMVERGALEEVSALLQNAPEPALPIMKAIGVKELGCYLAGQSSLETASKNAVTSSQQYAKRQRTWFRGQMGSHWSRFAEVDAVIKTL